MNFKKTLIFTLILAAVGGFIYFIEMPRNEKKAESEKAEKKILEIAWGDLTQVELQNPAVKMKFEKTGDQWRITQPLEDLVDEYKVRSLINAVQFEVIARRIPNENLDLKNFGLDKPRASITFIDKGQTRTILIGDNQKVGGNLFVKLADEKDILVVSDALFAAVDKSPSDFRERKLLREAGKNPVLIRLVRKGESYELTKKPDDPEKPESEWAWHVTAPYMDFADQKAADEIASAVTEILVTEFVAESGKDDPVYGLNPPAVTLTLGFSPEKSDEPLINVTLMIGSLQKGSENYFATLDHNKNVVTIDGEKVRAIFMEPGLLQDRHVARFQKDDSAKIHLQINGISAMISHSGADWLFEDKQKADGEGCRKLIQGISDMEGTRIQTGKKIQAKKYGMAKKSDFIELLDADGEILARVVRGKAEPEVDAVFVGIGAVDPQSIFKLAVEELEFWPKSVESLLYVTDNQEESENE